MKDDQFPLIHPDGPNGARINKCEENKEKIESAFRSDDRFPAIVRAFNFTRKTSGSKGAAKAICDIYVELYLSKEGKYPEGTFIRECWVHSLIKGDGSLHGRLLAKSALKGKPNQSVSNQRNRVNLKYINQLCQDKKLPYRAHSINKNVNTRAIVFWHPEFGYSSSDLRYWLKNYKEINPFGQFLIDKEMINKVNLVLFDNGLLEHYEVLGDGVFHDEKGSKRVPLFCKEHGIKTHSTLQNIEKGLWLNCPKCRRVDFDNIRKIQQLRRGELQDKGSSVVALMILVIDGVKTLKFGISSTRIVSLANEEVLKNRYNSNLKDVLISHRCKTELEARELEQLMLNETREIRNYRIPSSFAGYSECRVYGTIQKNICERAFNATIESELIQS
jgi:hypothetical protein